MYKISIDKNLFEDILLKRVTILKKDTTQYWKKELIEPTIINDKIRYSIKQVDKIKLTNGLGEDKPSIVIECKNIDYNTKNNQFEFKLGKIFEQRNTDIEEDYKDTLIEQLLREKAQLEDNINKDHLTQVYNRRKMENDLNIYINQNNVNILNTVFIDADRFKGINDNFGHDYGDKVLVYIAQKLKEYAKILNGEVYRFGGEEFIILCFCKKEYLLENLLKLKEDIKYQKIFHPTRSISVTVSMGVSFFNDWKNKDIMIKKADEAVFDAKKKGRDRIEVYNV
ncbi:hypothetical protein CPU12_01745 [Malaciobacter molluscorum LMG 25693]|uniref:diguanylate cyclase n=1 Tax=Malaciobacter molluscorum LMG 25693 TaxID=870501 RepID=A0A2G1DKQ5_9BACT|nr:GGDEF domain-containing protein [Malaciobacter molluscorum]AXX92569.1 diguanylate cyclase [Malaciobacter molluscorum LMG 25693]PHO18994.1 hypothetical protein CPU12_01745 [Malaciobacter molluscorum LMG 25693]RXJ97301.1 hypothetical protein CRV00_00235 [Malaciobacter molluscorum]